MTSSCPSVYECGTRFQDTRAAAACCDHRGALNIQAWGVEPVTRQVFTLQSDSTACTQRCCSAPSLKPCDWNLPLQIYFFSLICFACGEVEKIIKHLFCLEINTQKSAPAERRASGAWKDIFATALLVVPAVPAGRNATPPRVNELLAVLHGVLA